MMTKRHILIGLLSILASYQTAQAQYYTQQTRVTNVCPVYAQRVREAMQSGLYEQAIADKKNGKALRPKQKQRLEDVAYYRSRLKEFKCKSIP